MPAHRASRTPVVLVAVLAISLIAAVGCGGSSKPAYCTDRANLENSIKGLSGSVTSGGLDAVKTQLTTIQKQATTLVNSAKSDFPTETSAVKTSVASLESAIGALPAKPSAADLAGLGISASNVVKSVQQLENATKSKCD
jgi:hypothetical protein